MNAGALETKALAWRCAVGSRRSIGFFRVDVATAQVGLVRREALSAANKNLAAPGVNVKVLP